MISIIRRIRYQRRFLYERGLSIRVAISITSAVKSSDGPLLWLGEIQCYGRSIRCQRSCSFQLGIISPHLYMSRKNAKSKNIWLVIPCKKSFISRTVEYALDKINKWCFAHNWNFYICHYMSIFSFRLKTTEERFSAAMTAASLGEAVNAKSKVPGKLRRKPGASIFDQFWNSLGYHGCVQTMLSIMYLCICLCMSMYPSTCMSMYMGTYVWMLYILLHEVYVYIYIMTYYVCIYIYLSMHPISIVAGHGGSGR